MNPYYLARNGQQLGPFTPEQLRQQGIRRHDMVWRSGMSDWMQAGSVSELASLFPTYGNQGGYQQNPNPNPSPRPNPYAQQQPQPRRQVGLLVMSIFGIIGALIQLGVAAGMFIGAASERRGYYWDDDCYYMRSQLAEGLTVAGAVLLIFGIFFLILSIIGVVNGAKKRVRA